MSVTMKKTIISVVLGLPFFASAQMFNFGFKTSSQQFIEDAINGSIVCIEQKYALSDSITGEEFGRNELDYFNFVDYIGFKTDKGIITYSEILTPWENDQAFSKYKGKYKPILKTTILRAINDGDSISSTVPQNFPSLLQYLKGIVLSSDSLSAMKGLQIDTIAGIKNGWEIWRTRKGNGEKIDSVSYKCIKQQIEIPTDGSRINIALPDVDNEVLGGIYVTPKVTAPGQLTFYLNGVLTCMDGNWSLIFPFIKETTHSLQVEEKDKLTPIEVPNQLPRKPKFGKK